MSPKTHGGAFSLSLSPAVGLHNQNSKISKIGTEKKNECKRNGRDEREKRVPCTKELIDCIVRGVPDDPSDRRTNEAIGRQCTVRTSTAVGPYATAATIGGKGKELSSHQPISCFPFSSSSFFSQRNGIQRVACQKVPVCSIAIIWEGLRKGMKRE